MAQTLIDMMREQMRTSLKRKSLTTCSRWAEACRVMGPPVPGAYNFRHTPWTREMHDSSAGLNIGQKSAQAGYSETVLNRTLYKIDIERQDCLYVLPSQKPDASRFSAGRFDPALELSEHLGSIFSNVKNVEHKRAGTTNLYVCGSNARSSLKSIPVSFLVLDEYDEMNQDNVALAIHRLDGQFTKQIWMVSTPTAPNFGINAQFNRSTAEHFMFPCPLCGKHIELGFKNLKITGDNIEDLRYKDSYYFCDECKGTLPDHNKAEYITKGQWVATNDKADPEVRGFYVNQMYSQTIKPGDFAREYFLSQTDPAKEQEFFNSMLGMPHVVDGAKVSIGHFADLMAPHHNGDPAQKGFFTLGIDQGRALHYEVDQWFVDKISSPDLNVRATCKVARQGTLYSFEELDNLMREFNIAGCVIDANPETRKAFEFATRFKGYVWLNYYSKASGRNIRFDPQAVKNDYKILVDRTSWIDMALSRFFSKRIKLPCDTTHEYKTHITNLSRIYVKDADGNNIGKYVNEGPDHYAHARTYAEIALPLAASRMTNKDIGYFL